MLSSRDNFKKQGHKPHFCNHMQSQHLQSLLNGQIYDFISLDAGFKDFEFLIDMKSKTKEIQFRSIKNFEVI